MLIIYYVWSIFVDLFLFLRGLAYEVMWIPILRGDIFGWLFIAGFAIFGVWWNPLTGQSKWTAFSGAISAVSLLITVLTFTLLFNKHNLFQKVSLNNKVTGPLDQTDPLKVELVIGSGESQTRCVDSNDSALLLTLERDRSWGTEFPFTETSVEMGRLYRYFMIRPALRLQTKSLGNVPAYVYKAEPAVLFALHSFITSKQCLAPPRMSKTKKVVLPVFLAAGMLFAFTFGLWRITTITHPEPTYPVGIINSSQVALYELPTNQSKLIANLNLGEEVLVIKSSDNWYYVLRPNEQAGYVAKGFVNAKSEK